MFLVQNYGNYERKQKIRDKVHRGKIRNYKGRKMIGSFYLKINNKISKKKI